MLAVRNVEEDDLGGALPDMCSLCGDKVGILLVTPWDHIKVCRSCAARAYYFFRDADRIQRKINDSEYLDAWERFVNQLPQATSS